MEDNNNNLSEPLLPSDNSSSTNNNNNNNSIVAVVVDDTVTTGLTSSTGIVNRENDDKNNYNNEHTTEIDRNENTSTNDNDNDNNNSNENLNRNNNNTIPNDTITNTNVNNNTNSTIPMSSSFLAAIAVATIPMFLFGYNTGVLNAPESVIFTDHSTFQWSLAVSGFSVGGFFGANISGQYLADRYGRRKGLLAIFWFHFIAGMIHVLAPNMTILILARILVGIAGGASTVVTPMYLSEVSPKEIRGTTGTLTQLSCVIGILASVLWEIPFNSIDKWRFIFLPIPTMALLGMVLGPCVLLESPPWLLLNHSVERGQEALHNIRRLRDLSGTVEDDDVIEMMIHEENEEQIAPTSEQIPITEDAMINNENDNDNNHNEQQQQQDEQQTPPSSPPTSPTTNNNDTSFYSFALDPRNRIPLLSSILFPIAQQLSGINAVFYYSTALFNGVISNPQTGTIIAFTVNAVATIVAVLLMDKFGRKMLLSISAGGMFLCCILLTLSLQQNSPLPGMVTVIGVMLYIIFFELGLGCIPFFLSSEMIPSQFLGRVQSISMSCNWFSNFCVGMFFPYMDKYLGSYSFVPFAIVLFGTVLYSIFILPESRNKSPTEILQELEMQRQQRRQQGRSGSSGGRHQPVPVTETDTDTEFPMEQPEMEFV